MDFELTNRFHVAVRLFSNRSQMTSKCGKNKKVAHEAIEIHVYSAKSPKITTESTNMRSESISHLSRLSAKGSHSICSAIL